MSGRIKMIITIIGIFILLSIIFFILLIRFYPPLRLSLFGGEVPISIDDIQFWVKRVSGRNYYRVYAKYIKEPKTMMSWGHTVFFADSIRPLGFDAIFFNPEDNKIYGGGSESERGWEWAFFYLGEGKIEGEIFKPIFPQGTTFTFRWGGSLELTDAPAYYITIYLPGTLKKLEKEELEKGILAEIAEGEDYTRGSK